MTSQNYEEMKQALIATGEYLVIEKFKQVTFYNTCNNTDKKIAIFIDVETSGGNPNNDKIIEIALVPFEYSDDGRIFNILESYSAFHDHKIKIPTFITKLTGITDEMVAGHYIEEDKINKLVSQASIIIAHNASFDRKFVEKMFPIFKTKLWACTVAQIPWKKEMISGAKLEYLAFKFGVFYEAHRAEIDCLIGVHILSQTLPISKELAFKKLLEHTHQKYYRIWAIKAPYESKDLLKIRHYRWNSGDNYQPKSWYKEVSEKTKNKEIEFLNEKIYGYNAELKIEEIDYLDRFTDNL